MNNEMSHEQVSITGATGSIGIPLTRYLMSNNFKVRALVRNINKAKLLPRETEIIIGDINDSTAIMNALEGSRFLFHLAAATRVIENSPDAVEEYRKVNVLGTRNILDAAANAGIGRIVFFSTIDVYGKDREEVLRESSSLKPDSDYATSKLDAEEQLIERAPKKGIDYVILRLSSVYGPNMKGNYQRMIIALKKRRFIPLGNGRNQRSLIFESDVCKAALLAAKHPAASGNIYNLSDGNTYHVKEMIEVLCDLLGRKPPIFWLPKKFFYYGAFFMDLINGIIGKSKDYRGLIDAFNADIRINSERIQKELGFKPEMDLEQGWRITIEEWRRKGLI